MKIPITIIWIIVLLISCRSNNDFANQVDQKEFISNGYLPYLKSQGKKKIFACYLDANFVHSSLTIGGAVTRYASSQDTAYLLDAVVKQASVPDDPYTIIPLYLFDCNEKLDSTSFREFEIVPESKTAMFEVKLTSENLDYYRWLWKQKIGERVTTISKPLINEARDFAIICEVMQGIDKSTDLLCSTGMVNILFFEKSKGKWQLKRMIKE